MFTLKTLFQVIISAKLILLYNEIEGALKEFGVRLTWMISDKELYEFFQSIKEDIRNIDKSKGENIKILGP